MKITGHKHSIITFVAIALFSGGLTLLGGSQAFADNDHRDRNNKQWEATHKQQHQVVHSATRQTFTRERTVIRTVSRTPGRQEVHDYRRPLTLQRPEVRHTPRREVVVKTLPRGSRTVVINRERYQVHDGRYYRTTPRGYLLVRPPHGSIIANLPSGFIRVTFGGLDFFVHDNVFYRHTLRGYQVVQTPIGYQETDYGPVRVAAPVLNIRTGPGLGFASFGRLQHGDLLIVTAVAPDWYYVLLPNGDYGWVMSRHTSLLTQG